jgi:hypothetical protein
VIKRRDFAAEFNTIAIDDGSYGARGMLSLLQG